MIDYSNRDSSQDHNANMVSQTTTPQDAKPIKYHESLVSNHMPGQYSFNSVHQPIKRNPLADGKSKSYGASMFNLFNQYVYISECVIYHTSSWLKQNGLMPSLAVAFLLFPFICHALGPLWILILIGTPYVVAWMVYLRLAQTKNTKRVKRFGVLMPVLPFDPYRVYRVNVAVVSSLLYYLSPKILRLVPAYFEVQRIKRRHLREAGRRGFVLDVSYGARNGCKLDIYGSGAPVPTPFAVNMDRENPRPIIIFVHGGGWYSGDKKMYSTIAATYSSKGYIAVIPNYSLWPKGTPEDMIHDIKRCVEWTYQNAKFFGGDPSKIILIGQSSGAHLIALTLVRNAITLAERCILARSGRNERDPTIDAEVNASKNILNRLFGVILLSGPYNIGKHYEFESIRGVEEISCMGRLFGNTAESFVRYSPTHLVRDSFHLTKAEGFARHLPSSFLLIHSVRDEVVPFFSSLEFFEALDKSGIDHVLLKSYEDVDHAKLVVDMMTLTADKDEKNDFEREMHEFVIDCNFVTFYKRWLSIVRTYKNGLGSYMSFREFLSAMIDGRLGDYTHQEDMALLNDHLAHLKEYFDRYSYSF